MMDREQPLSFFVKALVFACLVLLYLVHPLLGWMAMAALGVYAIVRFVRRSESDHAHAPLGHVVR
jgi:hypothetical protein